LVQLLPPEVADLPRKGHLNKKKNNKKEEEEEDSYSHKRETPERI
jgi:hypothetical protein